MDPISHMGINSSADGGNAGDAHFVDFVICSFTSFFTPFLSSSICFFWTALVDSISFLSKSISCCRSPYADRIVSATENIVQKAKSATIEGLRVVLVVDCRFRSSMIFSLETMR